MPEVERVMLHWQHYPPLRALVAGFIGFEPTEPTPQTELVIDARAAEQIAQHFNAILGGA